MEKDEEETTYVESVMKQWQENFNIYSPLLSAKICSKRLMTWSICKVCPTMRKSMVDKKANSRHIVNLSPISEGSNPDIEKRDN
eukprot:4575119-Ditylum_brightwellii.AAC.1